MMHMLTPHLKKKLIDYYKRYLVRTKQLFDYRGNKYLFRDKKSFLNFSSNDYLSLAHHPHIKEAFIEGVQQFGVGSGASSFIGGYFKPQQQLEEKFAEYMQRDKAILFNSGYHANVGIIQALVSRDSNIVADKLCHASIIDGIRLSRANHYRYKHCDVAHVQTLLQSLSPHALVTTESVFSMEGRIAPVAELALLSQKHQAFLLVDDAHGVGVLGTTGKGISEFFGLKREDIFCLVTPLGKAMGGLGAFVSGCAELIDALSQFSRTNIYTTALPPAMICATIAALEIMQNENWRRKKLQELIKYFIQQAKTRQLCLGSSDLTPIKTIIIGDNQQTMMLQSILLEKGFFVSAIRPPTVSNGQACLRISLNYAHEFVELEQLLDAIELALKGFTEEVNRKVHEPILELQYINKNMIKNSFNKAYKSYNDHCYLQVEVASKLINQLQRFLIKPSQVLDLGCGTGYVTSQLVQVFSFTLFHAIDFSDRLLQLAKQYLSGTKIQLLLMDFDHITDLPEQYDLIFSNMSLHWSGNLKILLSKIYQKLLPEGIFAFSLPVTGTFPELKKKYIHSFFSYEDILSYLKQLGFNLVFTQQDTITQSFASKYHALKSLRLVGAGYYPNNRHQLVLRKSSFDEYFINPESNSLTYSIASIIAQKISFGIAKC